MHWHRVGTRPWHKTVDLGHSNGASQPRDVAASLRFQNIFGETYINQCKHAFIAQHYQQLFLHVVCILTDEMTLVLNILFAEV